jgi:prepilin-type N-terminal cleavage/methylation domain-containing protein
MKRAFTLIELIFVIVIIGLLAATAIPKFWNLKQHAQVNSVVKTTIDTAQQAAEVSVNLLDMEDNSSFELSDAVVLKGKGWGYSSVTKNGVYYYQDPLNDLNVSTITLDLTNRVVEYKIDCNNFSDIKSQDSCNKLLGTSSVDVNLSF